MRVSWTTDLHLNRMSNKKKTNFIRQIWSETDKLLISGDISSGTGLFSDLNALSEQNKEVYFTLGNHEFYNTSFAAVKNQLKTLPSNLIYLTESPPIELTPSIALIGDDGWYDSRYIFPLTNMIFWWDWHSIKDFNGKSHFEKISLCRELAWESAQRVIKKLLCVIGHYKEIIIVTHFPPVKQKHKLNLFDRFWTPYNTNKFLGESIQIIAESHPKINIKVLSGHSHHAENIKISENLECKIGEDRKLISII